MKGSDNGTGATAAEEEKERGKWRCSLCAGLIEKLTELRKHNDIQHKNQNYTRQEGKMLGEVVEFLLEIAVALRIGKGGMWW